jgi:hypothetical protein
MIFFYPLACCLVIAFRRYFRGLTPTIAENLGLKEASSIKMNGKGKKEAIFVNS